MSAEVECDGSVFCRIAGHVETHTRGDNRRFTHVKLTKAQESAIRERREALRAAASESQDRPAGVEE